MTKVYTRPKSKEEKTFECEECGTVWRDSWIDAEENTHRGWCPYCGEPNIPSEIIKLPELNDRPYDKNRVAWLRLNHLEMLEKVFTAEQNLENLL